MIIHRRTLSLVSARLVFITYSMILKDGKTKWGTHLLRILDFQYPVQ